MKNQTSFHKITMYSLLYPYRGGTNNLWWSKCFTSQVKEIISHMVDVVACDLHPTALVGGGGFQ